MKFTINKSVIENIIASMQPFLEKKDISSITSHIYFEIFKDELTLKSTDYEMGLETKINNITNYEDGKFTVNGSNLLNILKRLKDTDVIFESNNNNLIIKQNNSHFKLPTYDANEYPSFPNLKNLEKLNINISDLINSIKKITPAIDINNPKFELNGALIDIKSDKINFVSTDTRRLSISYVQNSSNKDMQLIIPKKAIIEIQKLFINNANINFDETYLVISDNKKIFFTKLINGKFPDYERIIPTNLKHTFLLSKDFLIDSIKLITSLKPNIKITFYPDNILFESVDEDSEAKTTFNINLNIKETFYIAVNSKYILDFLTTSISEKVTIGFNESNLPFYLKDDNFITIIMPIILDK
jgi:DNA polymerase-3 subunit beta